MYLIQVLLPVQTNNGEPIPRETFGAVRRELTDKFGGLTVYSRSPAEGLWQEPSQHTVQDDMVLVEVMVDSLDRHWWQVYRQQLEERFQQEEVVIRAQEIVKL